MKKTLQFEETQSQRQNLASKQQKPGSVLQWEAIRTIQKSQVLLNARGVKQSSTAMETTALLASSDGICRASEACTELPFFSLLPAYFLFCFNRNHHQWAGEEVNWYASSGCRARLLTLSSIKISMLFPSQKKILFPSHLKPQITRPNISFKKLQSHLKSLTSQQITAPNRHSSKLWIHSFWN